jgi:molybdate transport system substrate-binding protein
MLLLCCFAGTAQAQNSGKGPVVLAASSMQEALNAAADAWVKQGKARPVLSFAASSALARQAEAGAPADLFISADEEWMDHVAHYGDGRLLRTGYRADVASNALVLIAPATSTVRLKIAAKMDMLGALGANGRLAMADPAAVPAGRYGQQALTKLGVWDAVAGRVVRSENVRAALMLVARGEAALGVVYATDARVGNVRVVGVFPDKSHAPIRYPMAVLAAGKHGDAVGFYQFLRGGQGQQILADYGFGRP